jgi:hypothetical protein
MARKTISELQEELAAERDDNARLYAKVENLRAEISADEDDEAEDEDDEAAAEDEEEDDEAAAEA